MALPVVVIPADFPPLVSRSPLLPQLDRLADVRLYLDRPQSAAAQIERIAEADIVLNSRGSLSFPQAILQALPRLKMLAVCGIGYDSIHLPTATQHGIVVCNIPGRTAPIVAEHALALLLATARRMAWMTAEHRSVVVLRHYEDLKFREIADVLGTTASAVSVYLARGLKKFAQKQRAGS